MEYHPLPVEMKQSKPDTVQIATEAFTMVKVPFHALFKYGASIAVLTLVVVSLMAEKAVPGDALYAVKVEFNEELRSTLTFDGYQKVEWETERLNRRIAEARLLASEGRLTEEVEAEVAAAVREHTENAKREIEVLRTEDADEAAIASLELDATLVVQATALKGDEEEGSVVTKGTAGAEVRTNSLIATAIDESLDKTLESNASNTPPAFDKLMARVEQNTTRIYELSNALQAVVPAEEMVEVQRRTEDIGRAITVAAELEKTDDLAARKALIDVLQRTQRLIVFMTELEVVETVDIETLVPMVLTAEEMAAEMASTTSALEVKIDHIKTMLNVVIDEDILAKAKVGSDTLAELQTRLASSTDSYEAYMLLAAEAHDLADDMITLLESVYLPTEITKEQTVSSVTEMMSTDASSTQEIVEEEEKTDMASSTDEMIVEEGSESTATGTVDNI